MSLPWLTRLGGTAVVGGGLAAALWRRSMKTAEEAAHVHVWDLAVIGGGVVGTSIALHAARAGKSVVLLERHGIGSGATGLSAGTLYCEGKPPFLDLLLSAGAGEPSKDDTHTAPVEVPAEHLEAYLLNGSTEIVKAIGSRCSYVQSGCLTLARTEEEVASLIKRFEAAHKRGYKAVRLLDGPAAEREEPGLRVGSVLAALHTPLSGHCEPEQLAAALAADAVDAGADVREEVAVLDVVHLDDDASSSNERARYALRTADGEEILATNVAVACGAWPDCVREGLALDVPVVPVRGTIWMTAKLPLGTLHHVIYVEESHMAFADPVRSSLDLTAPLPIPKGCTHDRSAIQRVRHAYGRQRVDGRVTFGGDRIRAEPDDFRVDTAGVTRNREHVAGFLSPLIMATAVDGAWAGLMPFALDGDLLVGELSSLGLRGLWIATGFGSDGIMRGPMVGKLVGQAIAGVAPLPQAFVQAHDPCRTSGGVKKRIPPPHDVGGDGSSDVTSIAVNSSRS